VTVTGVPATVTPGSAPAPTTYHLVAAIHGATTTDPTYQTVGSANLPVTSTPAAVSLSQTALNLTEGGAAGTYNILLQTQPSATVSVALSYTAGELALSSAGGVSSTGSLVLTFTPATYNIAQTVTVSALHDFVSQGQHQSTITTVCAGGGYGHAYQPPVTVTIGDIDTAGVTVAPTSGLVTTEAGVSDTFTVQLTSKPAAGKVVAIDFASDTPTRGVLSATSSAYFDASNWNVAKTITVTGVADAVATVNGDVTYHITGSINTTTTTDTTYKTANGGNPVAVATVTAVNKDATGTVVQNAGMSTLVQGGAASSFTMVLTCQPSGTVTLSPTYDATQLGLTVGGVALSTLTFDASNWSIPQTVTVSPLNDQVDRGTHSVPITWAASGGGYGTAVIAGATAVITDTVHAGLTLTGSNLTTTESSGTAAATVQLASKPATGAVVVDLSSDNVAKGTVSPAQVTFTAANWNVPVAVTLTGVPATVTPGSAPAPTTYHLVAAIHGATTTDPTYQTVGSANLPVTSTPAAVSLSQTALNLTENGASGTYNIQLQTQPSATVSVTVTFNAGELALSSAGGVSSTGSLVLTFTPGNYTTAQTVTVSALHDFISNGQHQSTIAMTCIGGGYDHAYQPAVTVNIGDIDTASIQENLPQGGLTTTELGGTAAYTVQLTSIPAGNVIIDLSSSDPSKGVISATSAVLTFTPADWNVPQTVLVTGQPDAVPTVQADSFYQITGVIDAATQDAVYRARTVPPVTVTSHDPTAAGVTFTPQSAPVLLDGSLVQVTTEGAGPNHSATFAVTLASRPQADVTLAMTTDNPLVANVISGNSLTFTFATWNVPQFVEVDGNDDPAQFVTIPTNTPYRLLATVTSTADQAYAAAAPAGTPVTSIDHVLPTVTAVGLNAAARGGVTPFTAATFSATQPDSSAGSLVFTVRLVPAQGKITVSGVEVPAGGTFSQQDLFDGKVAYVNNGNPSANDGFALTATDLDGGVSALKAVTIAINVGAIAPVIGVATSPLTWTEGSAPVPIDLTATFFDQDNTAFPGGVLTVSISSTTGAPSDAAHDDIIITNQGTGPGQIGLAADGSVTYGGNLIGTVSSNGQGQQLVVLTNSTADNPAMRALVDDLAYVNDSSFPTSATRAVSVVMSDGNGGVSIPAIREIDVIPVNDAPTATGPAVLTAEGVAVAGQVAMTDPDNPPGVVFQTLQAQLGQRPAKGNVTLADDGSFTYIPAAGENGTDTFTVSAFDGTLSSNPTTVTVTISGGSTHRPWITSNAPIAATVGDNLRYTVTTDTTDLPAGEIPALQFSLVGAPDTTMTITTNPTNNTAIVQWPVAQPAVGDYVVFGIEVFDPASNTAGYQQVTLVIAPVNGNG
jgi:VCBS repeat-containing protein